MKHSASRRVVFIFLWIDLLMLSGTAFANDYYVSTSGKDSNDGLSPATAWASVSHAVASFSLGTSGATINVMPGAYSETVTVNRGGSSPTVRLVIKCAAQWAVGSSTGCSGIQFAITTASNVDIGAANRFGFEYTNPNTDYAVDGIWQCGSSVTCQYGNSIHVLGNYFHDIGQNVTGPGGAGCPSSGMILIVNAHGHTVTDTQVIGNLLDHFGALPRPSTCNGAHDIYIDTSGAVIENNIAFRGVTSDIQVYDAGCTSVVSNNVMGNNYIGLILEGSNPCTAGWNTINNNIIVNSQNAFWEYPAGSGCTASTPNLFSNNLLYGNGSNFSGAGSCDFIKNQQSENPTTTFVSYTGTAAGDYRLNANSIAIGGGTQTCVSGGTAPCTPSTDFAGLRRPASPSIGAYEFAQSSTTTPNPPTALTAVVQ